VYALMKSCYSESIYKTKLITRTGLLVSLSEIFNHQYLILYLYTRDRIYTTAVISIQQCRTTMPSVQSGHHTRRVILEKVQKRATCT